MNKKLIIGVAALVVVAGGVYFASGMGNPSATAAQATPTIEASAVKAGNQVVAEGKVVPVQSAALSLSSGGIVAEVLVAEGNKVEAGKTLVRLQSARQAAAVIQAESGLMKAQAALDQLKAGARSQELDAAQAAVDSAQASYDKMLEGATEADVKAAETSVANARAAVERAKAERSRLSPTQASLQSGAGNVASAQATLSQAEERLAMLKNGPTESQIKTAQMQVEQAKAALHAANVSRDVACSYGSAQCKPAEAQIVAAVNAVDVAQANLDALMAGARPEEIRVAEEGVASARAALSVAQAQYVEVKAGPKAADAAAADGTVTSAEAALVSAEAQLEQLKKGATANDLAVAAANMEAAKAKLELTKAGSTAEQIKASEADVAAAKAGVEQAKVALAETELKAPFAGTVGSIDLKVGENVAPGTPVVQLADLSSWEIETTDLTELSIIRVKEGGAVTITFDAIQDLEMTGKVVRIKPVGETRQGDITYKVTVKPDQQDERLRWNMTASVETKPES